MRKKVYGILLYSLVKRQSEVFKIPIQWLRMFIITLGSADILPRLNLDYVKSWANLNKTFFLNCINIYLILLWHLFLFTVRHFFFLRSSNFCSLDVVSFDMLEFHRFLSISGKVMHLLIPNKK